MGCTVGQGVETRCNTHHRGQGPRLSRRVVLFEDFSHPGKSFRRLPTQRIAHSKQAGVSLVNEQYPSDCIIFRYLVRPEQPQYTVAGHHEARAVEGASTSTATSAESLQLKPEKGQAFVTPSQTEGSDESAAARQLELAAQKAAIERANHARAANVAAKAQGRS